MAGSDTTSGVSQDLNQPWNPDTPHVLPRNLWHKAWRWKQLWAYPHWLANTVYTGKFIQRGGENSLCSLCCSSIQPSNSRSAKYKQSKHTWSFPAAFVRITLRTIPIGEDVKQLPIKSQQIALLLLHSFLGLVAGPQPSNCPKNRAGSARI